MENKNPPSVTFKASGASASIIRLRKRNTLYRDHDPASFLEEGHNTRLLLCYGVKNNCDEGNAIRLGTIIAHSLYPRLFNKHQQKILKEALEKRKDTERLYVE